MNRSLGIKEAWHPATREERDAIRKELEDILASPHFCNSRRYPALLRYIVEHTLEGRTEQLKERTLGVDVFDRSPSYDTNADTVVRYTAGEVRKRLALYYHELDRNRAIDITLPPGSYVPEFHLELEEPTADFDSSPQGDSPALHTVAEAAPATEIHPLIPAEFHPD